MMAIISEEMVVPETVNRNPSTLAEMAVSFLPQFASTLAQLYFSEKEQKGLRDKTKLYLSSTLFLLSLQFPR